MNVYDCFMYYDEDLILDLRLNLLNKYVNKFVIVESKFTHSGKKRNLRFDIKNFQKFRDKIIYIPVDTLPESIEEIKISDTEDQKNSKILTNAVRRENFQRNQIELGLKDCNENDLIIISDVDEIPNLENFFHKNKISVFYQKMFYYKFNLKHPFLNFIGSKACKKKYLKSPQWLRNIKVKNYAFYRLDTFFSKTRYSNIRFINNGGWHFTNLKSPKDIKYKLKSYLHHREFDINPLTIEEIENLIKNKKAIYDLTTDKKNQKIGDGNELEKYDLNKLPSYINNNLEKFKDWID